MRDQNRRIVLRRLFVALALVLTASVHAGPPLLCHEIRIGDAKSLPWGESTFERAATLNAAAATDQTLSLLDAESPVLVRMETLRRATLYLQGNPSEAERLLGSLMSRVLDAEVVMDEKMLALRYFDVGYFAATLQHANVETRFGPKTGDGSLHAEAPGYAWLVRAYKLAGGTNGDMALALALVTADTRMTEHTMFLEQAVKATSADDAARNDLLGWIAQVRGTTLEAVRAKYAPAQANVDARGDR